MYELVITIGNRYNKRQVLLSGTYGEISNITSNFNDTNELRESSEFKSLVDSFIDNHPGEITTVVILERNNYIQSSKEKEFIPHRVIYKSDKKLFDKLMVIPNKDDVVFTDWEEFWYSLRRDIPSRKIKQTSNNYDEVKKINAKISKYEAEFKSCSTRFKNLLNNLSQWYRISFNPGDSYFRKVVFPRFKTMIKDNSNLYYQVAEIVIKAFEKYVQIYKLLGQVDVNELFGRYLNLQNKSKHKVKKQLVLQKTNKYADSMVVSNKQDSFSLEDENIIDEYERVSKEDKIYDEGNPYRHSSDYLRLQPFIENRDVNAIKEYFELYYPVNMTQYELDEIQEVMKENNKARLK